MATKEDKILKALGKKIKKLRKEKGMTIREFAYTADIATSYVSKLESGLSNPSFTTLLKIAEVFGIDLNTLSDI